MYSGTNHRGIRTFSWLTEDDLHTFQLDLLDLAIALVRRNWIPGDSYLGLVEFGTETYYSNSNVTFSAKDFTMTLNTTSEVPTLDIPEPEVPSAGARVSVGFMHRTCILAMSCLVHFYFGV